MKKYIIVTIVVILILVLGITFTMFGKKKAPVIIEYGGEPIGGESAELYCPAGSEEEALRIAEAYSITLDHFNEGIAVFVVPDGRTTAEVIAYGEKNGLPLLVVNSVQTIK